MIGLRVCVISHCLLCLHASNTQSYIHSSHPVSLPVKIGGALAGIHIDARISTGTTLGPEYSELNKGGS